MVLHPPVQRPRAGIGRIVEHLGTTLLDIVAGPVADDATVETVVIHDPYDDAMPMRGAIVLGVSVAEPATIVELLHELAAAKATALVLRAPVATTPEVLDAVAETGIVVLALTRGASWAQLSTMLRSILTEEDLGEGSVSALHRMPVGDLFSLANAISTLIDAPITIEDRNSNLLAFSGGQDISDRARMETILGRQVPQKYTRLYAERGVFQSLYRSDAPIHVDPVDGDDGYRGVPRVALAVRAGDEVLGSIWAAASRPLSTEAMRALVDSSKLVAMHLLRLRAGSDVERRLRADLLATLLEGTAGSSDAAVRLRLQGTPTVVMALALIDISDEEDDLGDAARQADRERVADAFAMHLGAVYQRSAVAPIGNRLYAIVGAPTADDAAEERAAHVARDFIERLSLDAHVGVAIGTVAEDATSIPRSRRDADRAIRVLRDNRTKGPVAQFSKVQLDALLVELGDLAKARGDRPMGPVATLIEHDRDRGTRLVETLTAWLECFGDVTTASARVFTHQNTFRYRLRRLSEVSGLDLSDHDARFSAMVQLRLLQSNG